MSDLKRYLALKTQQKRWEKVISDAMLAIREHEGTIGALKDTIEDARYQLKELAGELKKMEEAATWEDRPPNAQGKDYPAELKED